MVGQSTYKQKLDVLEQQQELIEDESEQEEKEAQARREEEELQEQKRKEQERLDKDAEKRDAFVADAKVKYNVYRRGMSYRLSFQRKTHAQIQ